MIKAYYVNLSEFSPAPPEEQLSGYRREKLARVTNEAERKRQLAAEWLLREALRDFGMHLDAPLPIRTGEHAKPYLEGGPCFSLSHSGELVACAVGEHPLGLDVQRIAPYDERLAARYFHPDEQRFLAQSEDKDRAFTRLWAMKESYCKFDGRGLSLGLDGFSALDSALQKNWYTAELDGYALAVYSPGNVQNKISLKRIKKDADR